MAASGATQSLRRAALRAKAAVAGNLVVAAWAGFGFRHAEPYRSGGHTAVTRYGHTPSVPGGGIRPGADSGHEEPVTPDERAPFIRGRFVVPSIPCPRLVYPRTQRRPGRSRAFAVLWRQPPRTQAKGPGFLPGLRISRRLTCTRKSRLRNPSRRQSKSALADFDHFKKRVAA